MTVPEQVVALAVVFVLALVQQLCSKRGIFGESLEDAVGAKIQSTSMTAFGTTD